MKVRADVQNVIDVVLSKGSSFRCLGMGCQLAKNGCGEKPEEKIDAMSGIRHLESLVDCWSVILSGSEITEISGVDGNQAQIPRL